MVKNEEIWIKRVLLSLSNVFPLIIVADTGSTDATISRIEEVPHTHLIRYFNASSEKVGRIRGEMQQIAKGFGASHVMLVDGDELYTTKYLRYLYENPMPETSYCGFTTGVECAELPNGECWLYNIKKNRDAVFSVDSRWFGTYPFEGHSAFNEDPIHNHYWDAPMFFYHLHQMKRSSKDEDVFLRKHKQYKFSMQSRPDLKPVEFWLKNEAEYKDEI